MEEGTLIIIKTKRGLAAKISFTKKTGKPGEIPAGGYRPKDMTYHETKCKFLRDRGQLLKVVAHDDTTLWEVSRKKPEKPKKQGIIQKNQHTTGGGQKTKMPDSLSPQHTFLPKDTREVLTSQESIDNFGLKLEKAARYDMGRGLGKGKFLFYKRDRKGDNYEISPDFGEIDFKQLAARMYAMAEQFLPVNHIRKFDMRLDGRMIQGLGIESVYETSMTLHPVYGIPYLPASTIKGIVRSWIITQVFGTPEHAGKEEQDFPLLNAEFRTLRQSLEFCHLFGCPADVQQIIFKDGKPQFKVDKRGKLTSEYIKNKAQPVAYKNAELMGTSARGELIFFDAFPISQPSVEVDIMNPHYGPYYSDKKATTPPADYHSPVPIPFLTVSQTSFRFILGARNKSILTELIAGKNIFQWTREALEYHGIGAKTAVGYGFMQAETRTPS